jgi:drug/metabolite transporter (DMT)-like permease
MFIAADDMSAVDMSAWYMIIPVLTFVLGTILQVEKWRWFRLFILLPGTLGAILLVGSVQENAFSSDAVSFSFGRSERIFLIGCLMMAVYPVLSKRYIQKEKIIASALLTSFWSLLIGGICIATIATLTDYSQWRYLFENASATDYLWILYLGVGSSALTFFLMQQATLSLVPTQIVAYHFLVPILSLMVAWYHYPEGIQWVTIPGLCVVIVAVILLNNIKSEPDNRPKKMDLMD